MFELLNNFYHLVKKQNFHYYLPFEENSENKKINKNLDGVDEKKLKIDTLLFIKQFKNAYYKYSDSDKDSFNEDLYNKFANSDGAFDSGETSYDDDGTNIRIFDKYIIEYIKKRNSLNTYLICKNKKINFKKKFSDLHIINKGEVYIDLMYVIDMSDKDIFDYCFPIILEEGNLLNMISLLYSVFVNLNSKQFRIKLKDTETNCHPYILFEKLLL